MSVYGRLPGYLVPSRPMPAVRPAGQAAMSLADCQQAKQTFITANQNDQNLVYRMALEVGSTFVLTQAGEVAFAQQNPACAAIMASCALPWEPGGTGSFQTFPAPFPGAPPQYTWNTEADRQAWIAAHPNCGPYPPAVAAVVANGSALVGVALQGTGGGATPAPLVPVPPSPTPTVTTPQTAPPSEYGLGTVLLVAIGGGIIGYFVGRR